MKTLLIIILFLITPRAGAQIDSLKLAEQYHKSADSLYKLGDYMEAYNKEGWARTLERKDGERFSPFYKTLDSLVRYVVSDTTKYEHYLGYAHKFLAEGDIEYTYVYYNAALHYLPFADDSFERAMDSLIFTFPTDTVYVTQQRPARQLYVSNFRQTDNLGAPSIPRIQDTLYIRKDSSLFNGVYILKQPWNEWRDYGFDVVGYTLLVYHYENGIQQDYTNYNHTFKPKNFTQQVHHADSAFHREPETEGYETYLESIVNNGEGYSMRFSPAGDTLHHSYRDNNGTAHAIEFYPTGDTLYISKNSRNDDGTDESHSIEFNLEHKIIVESYDYHYYSKDSSYSIYYSLNEKRDTIRFYTTVNGEICGYYIDQEFMPDNSELILKTYRDNGQVVDFLVDSAVFIGHNNKIISEQEFIQLLHAEEYPNYRIEIVPKELQDEAPFTYMFFLPGEKRPSGNMETRTKKVKKIIKRYDKTEV